ncbi:EAL domain-containing protein [Lusitaniella coriacea LEGE 07157]|uniref:histidine kinase n=1 Tax=Lusitaniella coriacea LEGE 07157 TaxID=945747 RepID=A0A8J7JCU1_9CYAN|nr:EAL domain-containing protein [Lusitaniella coriacea]MBE9117660.1 EAL domain-containing protein [Lusitaniella coriacea LEGE 07157]
MEQPKEQRCCLPETEDSGDLTFLLSHQLRTPLTSIKGAIGLLLSGKVDPETDKGQRLLRIAAKNADRLVRFTTAIENDKSTSMKIVSSSEMERFLLEDDLRLAWECQEFKLVYQPIVCSKTNMIQGFEALLRWDHPIRGSVSPTEFIPIAEENQLIHDLGLWVLERACKQLRQWQDRFPRSKPLWISVNLSALQLLDPDLVDKVRQICEETAIAPGSLRLEITETALFEHSQTAVTTLHELKDLDIPLYLDDFGTGYSCLSRLNELSVKLLKVDRSFVRQEQWFMIKGILHLAMGLGLEAIIEGVETPEELAQVEALGCHQIQGYLFSQPVTADDASELLTKGISLDRYALVE